MPDLRRRALRSGKTVSRKAKLRSETESPASSQPSSRVGSRAGSRAGSTSGSIAGSDDELDFDDDTITSDFDLDISNADLDDRIEEILDRKRSSVQGREHTLAVYGAILRNQFSQTYIKGRTLDILTGITKSVSSEGSERETVFALKAIMLTIITDPEEEMYHLIHNTLRRTITDSESMLTKTEAIHALSTVAFFGGASTDETENVLSFLQEIVDTDGEYANAAGDSHVITAALQGWGLLASQLEEFDHIADEAVETFNQALDNSAVNVQIAAGEDIALVYEKSYTNPESSTEDLAPRQTFTPYTRPDELLDKVTTLSKYTSHRMSKRDKKALHSAFASILYSLENPGSGPGYSSAVREDESEYGSRLKLRLSHGHVVAISEWSMLLRVKALRRVVGSGWTAHLVDNSVIEEALVGEDSDEAEE